MKTRNVELSDYQTSWQDAFEEEKQNLSIILSEILVDIQHIGSTAVPNLVAKPIIDLMPIVADIQLVDTYKDTFEENGYTYLGENGIENRRFLYKGTDEIHTHHIHIFPIDSPDIKRHLAFRDYLRNHEDQVVEYSTIKMRLLANGHIDISDYISGKNAFVQETENAALEWYETIDK